MTGKLHGLRAVATYKVLDNEDDMLAQKGRRRLKGHTLPEWQQTMYVESVCCNLMLNKNGN